MIRLRVDGEAWHQWWRRAFGAFLAVALVVGLYISFRPGAFGPQEPPAQAEPEPKPDRVDPAASEVASEDRDDEEDSEAPEPDELTEAEKQALIDAARPPDETSVQVLDAGGGSDAANDAAEALRELGYDVVAINAARQSYTQTTVLYTDGNQAEADGLLAREDRVAASAANERLSEGVDLHVVVGPDW